MKNASAYFHFRPPQYKRSFLRFFQYVNNKFNQNFLFNND